MSSMVCNLCSGMLFYVNGHKACAQCGHVVADAAAHGVSPPAGPPPSQAAQPEQAEPLPEPPPAWAVRSSTPVEAWQAGVELGTEGRRLVGEAEELAKRAAAVAAGVGKDPQRAAEQIGRDLVAIVDKGAEILDDARQLGKRALAFLRS